MTAFITAIVTAILTFVLTGLVGNFLVQKWQQRNWFSQHRVLGAEKKFKELQAVFDEVVILGAARNFRARRLARHKAGAEPSLSRLRQDYDESVVRWNERLLSISTRLTMYAGYSQFAEVLEENIQTAFVEMGEKVETAIAHLLRNERVPPQLKREVERMANVMSGKLFAFSRDLLRLLIERQEEVYEGKRIPFSEETLDLFSTWDLFKAVFQAPQTTYAVR